FTGRMYDGAADVSLMVPLDEIPLFVKEGGIIATASKANRSESQRADTLTLQVFPGETGRTLIYEDDGQSKSYAQNQCAWTPVRLQTNGLTRRITIGPTEGTYRGIIEERSYEIRLRDTWPTPDVTVDDQAVAAATAQDAPG